MGDTLFVAGRTALTGASLTSCVLHRRRLEQIPLRIQVNAQTGGANLTRLIAAGLRAGGISTCAKTSGSLPRIIFPDGQERSWNRRYRGAILGSLQTVRTVNATRATAIVFESVSNESPWKNSCERRLMQPTHTVENTKCLVTTHRNHTANLEDDDVARVTWDELDRFSYVERPDTVAMALKVCQSVGVDRSTALSGMWMAAPSVGVTTIYHVRHNRTQVAFVNGFAIHDPAMTGNIWETVIRRNRQVPQRIAIVNCCNSMEERSRRLAESCVDWTPADHYVVVGDATEAFASRAIDSGGDPNRISQLPNRSATQVAKRVDELSDGSAIVMGMGSISGVGRQLVDHYRNRNCLRQPRRKPTVVDVSPYSRAA